METSRNERVCYVNPARLLRRPISELIARQEGTRRISLLIPSETASHERKLHHTELFKKAGILTYPAWHPPGPFEWPIPGLRFVKQGLRALREHDIVHIWAHFYPSNLLLVMKSIFFKKTKVILTMDSLPGYSFSMGPVMDLLFKLYTWTFGRLMYGIPDAITLYGEALLPHARRSGINMKKVRVIPTGIMPHKIPPRTAARKKITKELGRGSERIVLYAGLLNPRKRVQDVLEVADKLAEENITFLIAGDGPSKERLEKESEHMTNVHFLGWRKDVFKLLAAADLFLFPSSAEGLPGVVMEAMLAGTPVVTTRIPCTTDLIRDGKEGILCEVGDTEGMATATKELLENEKRARKLSKAAQRRIKSAYSWKRVLPLYEELYTELQQR